jgi:O-antigen/teichoic acid export membrane protein
MTVARREGAMTGIVRGGAFTLGGSLVAGAASMAQSVVVARGLDPHRLGVFAIVNYVLTLGAAIVDLGVPVAAMKLVAEYRVARPAAVRRILAVLMLLSVALATAGALALLTGAASLSAFYREPGMAPLFRLAAGLLFVSLVGAFLTGTLQGFRHIETLAGLTTIKAVTALGATLVLLPSLGLTGVIVASIVAELVTWPLMARPLRRALAEAPNADGSRVPAGLVVGRALALSVPIVLNGLVLWGSAWFIRSYLARAAGYEAVGYFHVADACGRLILLLPSALAVPYVPAVSEASALGRDATRAMVEATLRLTLLTVAPAAAFLSLAAEPVLRLVYGAAYAAAAELTSMLVLAAGAQAIGLIVWSTLVGAGRTWSGFALQAGAQVAFVVLATTLVPAHGVRGLGVAALASAVAAAGAGVAVVRRDLGVRVGPLLAPIAVAMGAAALALLLWLIGAAGVLEAAALATAVLALQLRQLPPVERRGLIERLRRRPLEAAS